MIRAIQSSVYSHLFNRSSKIHPNRVWDLATGRIVVVITLGCSNRSVRIYKFANDELGRGVFIVQVHHNFCLASFWMSNEWNANEPPFGRVVKSSNKLYFSVPNGGYCCVSSNSHSKLYWISFSAFTDQSSCLVDDPNLMLQKHPACVRVHGVVWIHFEPAFNCDQIVSSNHGDRRVVSRDWPQKLPPVK